MNATTIIKLKSLKEPTENESDGLRILIALYRPRYLPKSQESWDEWWKELAPSKSLWRDYVKDKKIDWPEYAKRFRFEITNNPESINALKRLSSCTYDAVTLLCHCRDEKYCHRSIIKEMIRDINQ